VNLDLSLIYPITDTRLSGISQAEQVDKLIAGGAEMIQLREKRAAPRDFYVSTANAIRPPHSPTPVPILTVPEAQGAKAIS